MASGEVMGAATNDQRVTPQLMLAFVLTCVLPVFLAWDLLPALWGRILTDDTFSHIPLIPAVSFFLVYIERQAIFRQISRGWRMGAGLVAAGAILCALARLNPAPSAADNRLSLLMFGLVVVWMGAFVCFFGTRTSRAALFSLLFLLFAVPIPEPLLSQTIYFLQKGSAEVTGAMFNLLGVPVLRQPGFVFVLPGVAIRVAEECSGIRSTLALLITAVLAGHLWLKSGLRILVLAVLVFPIAIVKNGMRIVTLSCLAVYVDQGFLHGNLHHYGGFPFFLLDLGMLGLALNVLLRTERRRMGAARSPAALPAP
jgi:exosortase